MRLACVAGVFTLVGGMGFAGHGLAATDRLKLTLARSISPLMSVIRYEDREPDQPAYISRILVLGEKMRMDYDKDDEGFVLFDRKAGMVWHVSPGDRRMTGIAAGKPGVVWPSGWKLKREEMSSEQGVLVQVRVNDMLCAEFKAAPMLRDEAAMFADFRRMLAVNQAKAWLGTPEELHDPCTLALDVHSAGIEYRDGLPLAIRYWDGRVRVHLGHASMRSRPELFELPAGYLRSVAGARQATISDPEIKAAQTKSDKRQPSASQAR